MYGFLTRNQFLLNFIFLSAFSGLSVGIGKFITSVLALDIGATGFELGLIAGAQSAGIIVMSLPVGVWVDRVGPQRLFVIGSLIIGLLYAVTGLLTAPWSLAILTFLVSLCMPLRFVSLNAVFLQKLDVIGVSKAGWFRAMHMIGFFMLAPVVSALLLKAMTVIDVFLLVGLLFFITAAMSPVVMRYYERPKATLTPIKSLWAWFSQFDVLRNEFSLFYVCCFEFVAQAVLGFYSFYIVVIAISDFGQTASTAALLVMVEGALFIAVLFWGGVATQKLSRYQGYNLGLAVLAVALIVLTFANGMSMLWLGAIVLGLGLGLLQVINIGEFAAISKQIGQGRVAGISAFVGPLGGLLGSGWGGITGAFMPLQWSFVGFVVLLVPLYRLIGRRYGGASSSWKIGALAKKGDWKMTRSYLWLRTGAFANIYTVLAYVVIQLSLPLGLFLLWYLASKNLWVPEQLLPSPALVYASLQELYATGELWFHTSISLTRLGVALLIGTFVGVLLGAIFGLLPRVHRALFPTFNVLAQFPVIGWIPILIIALGIDEKLKIAAITLAVIPPIVVNLYKGIQQIPLKLVEAARVLRFSLGDLFRWLLIPATVPAFFQGLRQAVMQGWITLVFVELLSSSEGLGYLMVWGRQLMQLDLIVVAMIVIGGLGFLFDKILSGVEFYSQAWRLPYAVKPKSKGSISFGKTSTRSLNVNGNEQGVVES